MKAESGMSMEMSTTYLFVPAHETRKVSKALTAGSDAVILDLEDGVPPQQKDAARAAVLSVLRSGDIPEGLPVWVRVNPAGTAEHGADLQAIDWLRAAGAALPKAEAPDAVDALVRAGARRVMLLVETLAGFDALAPLAARGPRDTRVALGTWDLAIDLRLDGVADPDDSELIWQLRGMLALQCRRLGLAPPIDGIFARLDDDAGLRDACARVRRLGFAGKLVIHPRQIPVVSAVFRPDAATLALARDVVRAYEDAARDGRGAVQVGGRLVDLPMVERARALLARWGEL